jgi:hypothetical protein
LCSKKPSIERNPMKTINVEELPEPVALVIETMVETLKT